MQLHERVGMPRRGFSVIIASMIRTVTFILGLVAVFCATAADYTGQVLIKNPELLILKGEAWSGRVDVKHLASDICAEGDIVRIDGTPTTNGWLEANRILARKIDVLEHRPLPATEEVPGGKIPSGEYLYRFVRTTGTVASVVHGSTGWSWMILRTTTGDVGITIRESNYPYEALRRMIDAEISIRGIVLHSWGNEQRLGAHMSLRGENAIQILRTAPEKPFDAPSFQRVGAIHRVALHGSVLAIGLRRTMIRAADGMVVQAIPSEDAVIPPVGRRVTIVGFAETDPLRPKFTETLFRDEGESADGEDEPLPTETESLFAGFDHGKTIRVEGPVRALYLSSEGFAETLTMDVGGRELTVDISALRQGRSDLPPEGSVLAITGVCVSEYESSSPSDAFPRFRRALLIPRRPADIRIVSKPSWWTPAKLAVCLLVLLILAGLREFLNRSAMRLKLRERTSLAIELHDSLAQFLTGVSLQLDAAEMAENGRRPEIAKTHIGNARAALKSCRENLRYCLGDLRRTAFAEPRMNEAIRQSILPHIGQARLSVRFNASRSRLSDSTVHAIISIARELSVNSVRHGHARRIFIAGEHRDGRIRFSVRDDGIGFEPANCPGSSEGHYGLLGIRERLRDLRGEMRIESRPGKGTKTTITITP